MGDKAKLIPEAAEDWLISRIKDSPAKHYAMVPSHPIGWTAGKWREWYPEVVVPEGFTGVVTNELLADVQGHLTTTAQKYFWQKGWWDQHQRQLEALVKFWQGSRMIFSGDIHAQGVVDIRSSGDLVLEKPVKSILVGPVSTSDATWPSAARGIAAGELGWVISDEVLATREVNGFTIFEFEGPEARVRLFDCGGYDRSKGEGAQRVDEIVI
ncbi:MAG: hypothetical protein VB957_04675 [Pseudomonadales bacterium]